MNFGRLVAAMAVGVLIAGSASTAGAWGQRLDDFAKCITDGGATFYGTYWCPQCDRQREAFGRSDRYLNYVECASRDSDEAKRECKRADTLTLTNDTEQKVLGADVAVAEFVGDADCLIEYDSRARGVR